jgi:hypothetical protein
MDPDPGGPKTYGSGSATLVITKKEAAYFLVKLVAALVPQDRKEESASFVEDCGLRLLHTESSALPFRSPRCAALLPGHRILG